MVKSMIINGFDAINGTIIMYGQTGSGKTYTMIGDNFSTSALPLLRDNS